jgi:cell division protease FtsH
MVTRYGMVEALGYVTYEAPPNRFLDLPGVGPGGERVSAETQQRIDEAVRTIVMNAFAAASAILERHRSVLERCARELLAKETLDEAALAALTAPVRAEAAAQEAARPSGAVALGEPVV